MKTYKHARGRISEYIICSSNYAMRMDRHQEEAPTSQLGWHLGEPLSYAATLKILLKKEEKYLQEGGLGQDPQSKKKRMKNRKERK